MNITKSWGSSLEMLCKAVTAAAFSCCLYVALFAFSLVSSNWKACCLWLSSGDWLGRWRVPHFCAFRDSWVALVVCFGLLHCEDWSSCFAAFVWIWAQRIALCTSEFILLLLFAVTLSINTSDLVPLAAIYGHAIALPPCLTDNVVCLKSCFPFHFIQV